MARKRKVKTDDLITEAFNKHGFGVQIPILEIPAIFTAGRKAFMEKGPEGVEPAVKAAIEKYRLPPGSDESMTVTTERL